MKPDWRYSVNCVLIRHNSQALQDKLKSLGFIDLRWTTCLEARQNLIASSYEHTVKGVGYNPVDKHYMGSFFGIAVLESPKLVVMYSMLKTMKNCLSRWLKELSRKEKYYTTKIGKKYEKNNICKSAQKGRHDSKCKR